MRRFGITGRKNAGKTTLVERLVTELVGRGLRVATLKHAHHAFDVDQPGRDSHRHRVAGAAQVLVSGGARWALMSELQGAPEPDLDTLIAKLDPADIVLIEGWKHEAHPKIEVWRSALSEPPLAAELANVVAVAADVAVAGPIPCLPLDDIAAIADLVLAEARP